MATCSYGFSTRATTSLSVLCGSRVSGEVTSLRRNGKSVAPHSLTCEQGRNDCGGPFKPGKCCQKAIDGVARLRIVEAKPGSHLRRAQAAEQAVSKEEA